MRGLAALLVTALLPVAALAESHPLLSGKVYVQLGDFVIRSDVDVRVDGTVDALGSTIDLEADLGSSATGDALAAELRWRFADRWNVATQLFKVSDSSSAQLQRDIEFGGYEFRAGIDLSTSSKMQITRLFFGREYSHDESHEFGIGGGLHVLDLSATVTGEAWVDTASIGRTTGAGKASGPLPNLGAWYNWAPNDRLAVTARLDWLSANIDPYDGAIVNASAGIDVRIAQNFGVGVNYNVFSLSAGVSDSGWRGSVDIRYHGPYAYISAYW